MPAKYVPDREIDFAVNVGFLTKEMWREFFADGGLRWQQMLWRQLLTEGYFRVREDWPDLYLPNPTHPFVKKRATFLARAPHISQLAHDELVARSYWLLREKLPDVNIKTEALLQREVPVQNRGRRDRDSDKHPDLVVTLGDLEIAIEIELNQKSRRRYEAILRTYRKTGFSKVIYIVRSNATMNAIERAAGEVSFPRREIHLGYASMADWRGRPALAPITFDLEELSLTEILKRHGSMQSSFARSSLDEG